MKHFISTADWNQTELQALLNLATQFKQGLNEKTLKGKSVALLFFNPSLRTRTSFELGTWQLGGHAIVLEPGKSSWPLEFEFGSTMDSIAEEHVIEAARVLSRYCDLICIRAFPEFECWQDDRQDKVINSFARHATVPVVNMETITHPCQELAHMQTIQEKFCQFSSKGAADIQSLKNKKYVLTWTYHPKALNTAVANSSLLIASKFGMDITLLCPTNEYLLDERFIAHAKNNIKQYGGSFQVSHDIDESYENADIVYAKSWGALPYFGNWDEEKKIRDQYKHFIVNEEKMAKTNNGLFSHCLPLRRNIKATDAVMDSDYCIAIDEAENRLHVQKAIMTRLISQ